MKVTVSPSSLAFIVTMSSLPAHLSTLARLARLMPAGAAGRGANAFARRRGCVMRARCVRCARSNAGSPCERGAARLQDLIEYTTSTRFCKGAGGESARRGCIQMRPARGKRSRVPRPRTHAHGPVAAEVLKPVMTHLKGDKRHVARVHGLQLQSRGGAVEVGLSDQVLHGVHQRPQDLALHKPCLKHGGWLLLLLLRERGQRQPGVLRSGARLGNRKQRKAAAAVYASVQLIVESRCSQPYGKAAGWQAGGRPVTASVMRRPPARTAQASSRRRRRPGTGHSLAPPLNRDQVV